MSVSERNIELTGYSVLYVHCISRPHAAVGVIVISVNSQRETQLTKYSAAAELVVLLLC